MALYVTVRLQMYGKPIGYAKIFLNRRTEEQQNSRTAEQ